MRARLPNTVAIFLSSAALLFLFSGHLKFDKIAAPRILPLSPENGSDFLLFHNGFTENAVFPSVPPPRFGQNLQRFGSWLGSDASTGDARSAWFPYVPTFSLFVAGRPSRADCDIYVDTQDSSGISHRIHLPPNDPGESWSVRTFSLPPSTRFRITAIDHATGPGEWVGFSQPFQFVQDSREFGKQLAQIALVILTASASLVALLFPGLLLRRFRPSLAFIWLPLPGFLTLAALGLLCWIGPHALTPRRISQLVLAPLFAAALYHALRFPLSSFTSQIERRVLLSILLLTSLSVAKATYSLGPLGELYRGQIGRTLEVGDRSDSRIPYSVLQLIASRSNPHGPLADSLFNAWGFSSRPPVVALAASPIVLAIPVHIPAAPPAMSWTVFDPEGFSAFQIVMIVIACCTLTAAFGVAQLFLDEQWSFIAFLVTATAPFVIHETYFTWPKLEAAWFVLLAAYLIFRGRLLGAGLLWGFAYLCHGLALLSAPALLGIAFLSQPKQTKPSSRALRIAALIPGLALCIGVWVFINRNHFNQTSFLSYFQMADGAYNPSPAAWLLSRWNSLANTLLPLNLFLFHANHHSINSVFSPSPPIIHLYFQYWTTLPFGVGIAYFCCLPKLLYAAFSKARPWLLLVAIIPFACFWLYWGENSAGLLREGLHPWILGLLIFSVVIWHKIAATHRRFSTLACWALLFRGIETLLMLLLPAIWTNHKLVSTEFLWSDSLALAVIAASTASLSALTFRQASAAESAPEA